MVWRELKKVSQLKNGLLSREGKKWRKETFSLVTNFQDSHRFFVIDTLWRLYTYLTPRPEYFSKGQFCQIVYSTQSSGDRPMAKRRTDSVSRLSTQGGRIAIGTPVLLIIAKSGYVGFPFFQITFFNLSDGRAQTYLSGYFPLKLSEGVVAQMSLPTPENPSSNPVINN